jgi:hypothetical protein
MAEMITVTADDLDTLTPQQLRAVMVEEIRLTAEAIAEVRAYEGVTAENVLKSLYWSSPYPEECGEDTLSRIMFQASFLLATAREHFSIRQSLMLLPQGLGGTATRRSAENGSAGRTAPKAMPPSAMATHFR